MNSTKFSAYFHIWATLKVCGSIFWLELLQVRFGWEGIVKVRMLWEKILRILCTRKNFQKESSTWQLANGLGFKFFRFCSLSVWLRRGHLTRVSHCFLICCKCPSYLHRDAVTLKWVHERQLALPARRGMVCWASSIYFLSSEMLWQMEKQWKVTWHLPSQLMWRDQHTGNKCTPQDKSCWNAGVCGVVSEFRMSWNG